MKMSADRMAKWRIRAGKLRDSAVIKPSGSNDCAENKDTYQASRTRTGPALPSSYSG
jgi:hypothetical protein